MMVPRQIVKRLLHGWVFAPALPRVFGIFTKDAALHFTDGVEIEQIRATDYSPLQVV